MKFARAHPALSVAGAAGVGLIGGLELVAGLLIGAGVTTLLHRGNGEAPRRSQPIRDRARRVLERTPRELTQRGRAVVQALRGKLAPVENQPEDGHGPATRPPPAQPGT